MSDRNSQLKWTDEQWNKVRQVVYEEARGARVAGNFLPLYGPLDPDASYVTKETLIAPNVFEGSEGAVPGFTVADTETLKLATLQTKVYLRTPQVADPSLTSALIAFRRAANVLARLEDEVVFRGGAAASSPPRLGGPIGGPIPPGQVRDGQDSRGLLPGLLGSAPNRGGRLPSFHDLGEMGEHLVSFISGAVGELEADYHLGPFACVLDQVYFSAVQTPNASSLVLPQDRILPFLVGGALVRSSVLPPRTGLLVALGGAPIDLVVGTDITVEFLQVTEEPMFVFRVYEKIVLRIKDDSAVRIIPTELFPPVASAT